MPTCAAYAALLKTLWIAYRKAPLGCLDARNEAATYCSDQL